MNAALLRPRLCAMAAAVAAAGCTPLSEIVLVLHTDLHPPDEVEVIEIEVIGQRGAAAPVRLEVTAAVSFPVTLGLRPAGEPGPVTIRATARVGRTSVVEQRTRTAFVRGESRLLAMELLAACRGVACEPAQTCAAAGCRDDHVPGSALPRFAGYYPAAPSVDAREPAPPPDAGPPLVVDFEDDFDDGFMDPDHWRIGVGAADPASLSTSMRIAERDGELQIEPHANRGSRGFKGYLSVETFDLRGALAQVEVREVTQNGGQSIFALDTPGGSFAFRIQYNSTLKRNFILFEDTLPPATSFEAETYRQELHRFWRFRHDAEASVLHFETGPGAGGPWTVRRSTTVEAGRLETAFVALYAGTATAVSPTPGIARFDNLSIGRPQK